jgi:hypothetical protein
MKLLNIIFRYSIGVILLCQFLFTSCSDKLDISSVEVASETLQWKSISDTKSALLGSYGLLRKALVEDNSHWIYGELRSGDFEPINRADLTSIKEHNLRASHPIIKNLSNWRRFYAVINATSVFIERAPEVLELDNRYTEYMLKADIAQARAIRAFVYFYMVRIWGDVPLITKSFDDESFVQRKRTDQTVVLNFAENELLSCVENLPYSYGISPTNYYGESSSYWRKILFNKLTAYAILAHISAWQGKYINVDTYTKFIMERYSSISINYININNLTKPDGLFSNNYDSGQLLSISAPYTYGEATATGHIEQLTLAEPHVKKQRPDIYVPKDSIIKIFTDLKDQRFGIDTISGLPFSNYFTNYSGEIPVFSKIKVIRDGVVDDTYAVFGSNLIFTRLEEITLLRAEALAVLGARDEAMNLLNRVRNSRNVKAYSIISPEPIIDEIFLERRRELMGEGWRWYDQIRFNKIKSINNNIVDLIAKDGIYWPIANEILLKNREVIQNEYWK